MNIAHSLEQACRLFPDKTALLFEEKQYTYRQLDEMSNRIANGLAGLGIGIGERVALFLPNIPAFLTAYYAIHKLGAVVVSINPKLKADEVAFILNDSGARAVFTTASLRAHIAERNAPALQHILIAEGAATVPETGPETAPEIGPEIELDALMAQASPLAQALDREADDIAEILYTSGTTGFPKGATHSQGNLLFNARATVLTFRMRPADRVLLFLAASHNFGLNTVLTPCVEACATLVLQREFDVEAATQAVAQHGVTMFFGVPTIFTLLLEKADPAKMRGVRFYMSAAANLPLEISRKWQEKFGAVIGEGYGLTECVLVTYNHYLKYRPGSIGAPFVGLDMRIVDENDRDVAPGELGEVVIAGPNVMPGYWQQPEATAAAIRQGWFHTGDIGRRDEDGYFYIVDRVKDMVNVGGLKVYPSEVENVLYTHPAVREAAVYAISHPVMGEQVRAAVVLAQPGAPDTGAITGEAIIAFCRRHLAEYKTPSVVELVAELPKSPTGKILKRVLREEAEQAEQANSAPKSIRPRPGQRERQAAIESWLVTWLARHFAVDAPRLPPDGPLTAHGLTSVFAVNLAQGLSDWLGEPVQPVITFSYPSIAALARHLAAPADGGNGDRPRPAPAAPAVTGEEHPGPTASLSDAELAELLAAEIAINQRRGR